MIEGFAEKNDDFRRARPMGTEGCEEDYRLVSRILEHSARMGSEYCPAGLTEQGLIFCKEDTLSILCPGSGGYCGLFPAGRHVKQAVSELTEAGVCEFYGLTDIDCRYMEHWFPGEYVFTQQPEAFDHCCHIEYAASMDGSRYREALDLIGRLHSEYPETVLLIRPEEGLPEVLNIELLAEDNSGTCRIAACCRAQICQSARIAHLTDAVSYAGSMSEGALSELVRLACSRIIREYPAVSFAGLGPDADGNGLGDILGLFYPDMIIRKYAAHRKTKP